MSVFGFHCQAVAGECWQINRKPIIRTSSNDPLLSQHQSPMTTDCLGTRALLRPVLQPLLALASVAEFVETKSDQTIGWGHVIHCIETATIHL